MDYDELFVGMENTSPLLTTFGGGPGNSLYQNIVTIETDAGAFDDVVSTDTPWTGDVIHYDLGSGLVTTKIDSIASLTGTVVTLVCLALFDAGLFAAQVATAPPTLWPTRNVGGPSAANRCAHTATASSASRAAERSASSSVLVSPWPRMSRAASRQRPFSSRATSAHVSPV